MDGNATQNLTSLDPNSILQSDVTLIAGLLVLLTISGILQKKMKGELWTSLRWFIAASPVPFAISAGVLLIPPFFPTYQDGGLTFARVIFVGGLVFLTVAVIVILRRFKPENLSSNSS